MKFTTLEEATAAFRAGKISFLDNVIIGEREYEFGGSNQVSFDQIIRSSKSQKHPVILYVSTKPPLTENEKDWMLFTWSRDTTQRLVPSDIIESCSKAPIVERMQNDERDPNIIGDTVSIRILSLTGSKPIKGKVDTGAEVSSLHVDRWSIRGDRVDFVSSILSPNTLSLPLVNQQAVKSVNGVQYRPVVELNIRINDKTLAGVMFNLSDRKQMDFPILVGRNVLEKGKFLIDPRLREDIDWDRVEAEVKHVSANQEEPINESYDQVQQIYEILKDNNVTFSDLIRFIRTEVVQTFEDVHY